MKCHLFVSYLCHLKTLCTMFSSSTVSLLQKKNKKTTLTKQKKLFLGIKLTVDKLSRYILGLGGYSRVEVYGEFVTLRKQTILKSLYHLKKPLSRFCMFPICVFMPLPLSPPKPQTKHQKYNILMLELFKICVMFGKVQEK